MEWLWWLSGLPDDDETEDSPFLRTPHCPFILKCVSVKTDACLLLCWSGWFVMGGGLSHQCSSLVNCSSAIFRIDNKNFPDITWIQLWFGSKTLFQKAYSYLHRLSRWRHCKLKVAEPEVSWQHCTVYPLYTKPRNQTATQKSHWKSIAFLAVLQLHN